MSSIQKIHNFLFEKDPYAERHEGMVDFFWPNIVEQEIDADPVKHCGQSLIHGAITAVNEEDYARYVQSMKNMLGDEAADFIPEGTYGLYICSV